MKKPSAVKESVVMKRTASSVPAPAGFFCAFFALATVLCSAPAAARDGRLAGKVVDILSRQPVEEALVAIQGTETSTLTDEDGEFSFDVPEGTVSISIYHEDYFTTNYQDIEIVGGRITTYLCEMVPGDPGQDMFFQIGGITVLDQRELLPDKTETVHEISSAEIEHHLSSSLGDVLEIIPGVERTAPPGLSRKTQVGLRGASDVEGTEGTLALFGTKIMVDGITLSNNANLQSGTGTSYGSVSTTAGSQIDLRTIPADNIESVEVVTGVPSVEYGDLTTGLVKVKTKTGRQPHRLKIKSNPDTKEGNVNGGFIVRGTALSYNANVAYSERDIRREGDEYYRYNGQLTFRNEFIEDRLSMMNKFYYTGVDDEQNVDVGDPLSIETYNRDKTYLYGQNLDFRPTEDTRLEWSAHVRYTKRDSYQQKLVGADVRVLTDAEEEGTYPGVFGAGAYLSRIWTKGEEWNVGAKLNFRWDFSTERFDHGLLFGGEYTFDDNNGQGKIFDPFLPPYGNPGQRPLPFDASPALKTASIYLEDNITGSFRFRPWSLNLGFRYEMYTPEEFNLEGLWNDEGVVKSKNGTYVNPRIRFKYELMKDTQVRASWGRNSKMPSMTRIFQGPMYLDIVEDNVSPPDSMPLVSTYIYNYDNTYLKGYVEEKGELSLDRKFGPVGLILTGFYSSADDMPRYLRDPITIYRYRWTDYPDPASREPIDTIYTDNDSGNTHYQFSGWYRKYGLEYQLITKRLERLSTVFRITGSYYKTTTGGDGTSMSGPRFNDVLGRTIYPIYPYTEGWRRKMIVNYSADWFIKKLGMWVTFFLQQTLFQAEKDLIDPDPHAHGYFDPETGRTMTITPSESASLGLDRTFDQNDLRVIKTPNDRLLFNINVSKSIGKSAEVSMFVHNVFDDQAYYQDEFGYFRSRNHDIFYGIEFSMILDDLIRTLTGSGGELE